MAFEVSGEREDQEKAHRPPVIEMWLLVAALRWPVRRLDTNGLHSKPVQIWQRRTVSHLSCCQDPAQTVDRQDTRGLAAPLCHTKMGQSLEFLSSSGKPSATLGPQPQQHHHQEYHREAKGNSQIVSLCYCQEIQELLGLCFLLTPVKPILLRVLWWELLLSPTGLGP